MTSPFQTLINDCALIEGRDGGDFYKSHGKTCISLPGALKIAKAYGIHPGEHAPLVSEAGGRVVISGHFFRRSPEKGGKEVSYWTSGEANPNGKAVEGSHPVAMAEKRWRVRGILGLALDPSLRTSVYGEDEFSPDFHQPKAAPSQQATAPPPQAHDPNSALPDGVPAYAESLPSEWNSIMGEICELTGQDRAGFETRLYDHSSKSEFNGRSYCGTINGFPNFKDYAWGLSKQGKPLAGFAIKAKDEAKRVAADLAAGVEVKLVYPSGDGFSSYTLKPKAKATSQPSSQPSSAADLIPDDVPF